MSHTGCGGPGICEACSRAAGVAYPFPAAEPLDPRDRRATTQAEAEKSQAEGASPVVRPLRVTDIRCQTCDAPPGGRCRGNAQVDAVIDGVHQRRIDEHAALVAAGWQWQERETADRGRRSTP